LYSGYSKCFLKSRDAGWIAAHAKFHAGEERTLFRPGRDNQLYQVDHPFTDRTTWSDLTRCDVLTAPYLRELLTTRPWSWSGDRIRYPMPARRALDCRVARSHDWRMETVFRDADVDYLAWVEGHPDGFVLNTYRSPRANYLRLHRARCRMITGRPPNGRRWTATYIKVCGTRDEVVNWAMRRTGGGVWDCPVCVP
jgi:hypothetical protein